MADFLYSEGICESQSILDVIKNAIEGITNYPYTVPETPTVNTWLVEKSVTDGVTNHVKELVLTTTAKIGYTTPQDFEYSIRLINEAFHATDPKPGRITFYGMLNYDEVLDTADYVSTEQRIDWVKNNADPQYRTIQHGLFYYLMFSNNVFYLCAVGDPSIDYLSYKIALMGAGPLLPYAGYNENDNTTNLMLFGTNEEKVVRPDPLPYGPNTSYGDDDIAMFKTKAGAEWQKHYPAFITHFKDLVLETNGFQQSRHTGRYHNSPFFVVHPVDGYRGKLDKAIGILAHNAFHLDEFTLDVAGKPWIKEVYRFYNVDSTNNLFKNSANPSMKIAIIKEVIYS